MERRILDTRLMIRKGGTWVFAEYVWNEEQTEAILKRQWNRMLELGGNIYFTAKLGATDGLSFQQVAAKMTGMSQEGYAEMMLKGGRPVEGNRSKAEWEKKNG